MRKVALGLGALGLAALPAAAESPPPAIPPAVGMFDPAASLTAPLAYMLDMGSGRVLFQRDANRRFLPASLTKIMTAYVAFEMLAARKLHPDQRFVMSDAAFRQWHQVGSTMFIGRGQSVSVDELLMGIMTVSANDGCIVLAEGAKGSVASFVAEMNATAVRLGMRNSHFGSPNGWPDQGATYTTAQDLALLTQAMIARYPAYYRRYVGHAEMTFNGIRQSNHVPVLGSVAGADGVKTGFTNEAGFGFVGSAARDGRRLVMVVGGYDQPWRRARESRAFLEWGFRDWRVEPLFRQNQVVGSARVQGGSALRVPLQAPLRYYLTMAPGEHHGKIALTLRYEGPLQAPLRSGQTVGTLRVSVTGEPPRDLPLVAAVDVRQASGWERLRNGLAAIVGL